MNKSGRYLVTGGAGFIGSHLVEALLKQGASVRVLDNFTTGRQENLERLERDLGQLEIIHGDLRDRETVKAAVTGTKVVFHLGAVASVPGSIADPVGSLESNVNGTQNVLIAARDGGVRRVVYASSSAVYGDAPILPKQEDMAVTPVSPYAVQKLSGELLCGVFTRIYGLETVALRYFNVFGPRQDPASEYAAVIPRFLTTLLKKQRPIIFGDGEQTRDFIYIENVVRANLLAATVPAAVGQAINIGSGERISLMTVLHLARELLGISIDAEYHEARAGDVRDSVADIHKARQLLGYVPAIGLREGLEYLLKSLQESLV
jgi:nucleoside-diphosphate-sugar epimerase